MKTAKVIIGSAFGDEGKGLFTDYLSSQSEFNTCVARFNGGAQAGHTVQTLDGHRHVFSHFGSGSFIGLPTFLSSFFVCNPIIFLRELGQLTACGVTPQVFADETCPVTTPYDMMVNQIVEQARGKARHGSVGVGFGETLERQSGTAYALQLCDLKDSGSLRQRLDAIRGQWVFQRLKALGVESIGQEWVERFHSEAIREAFMSDAAAFLNFVSVVKSTHLQSWDHLIFEGAQGLLLDQHRGWFPHVTRSNTGIRNVLALADMLPLENLDVYYLTRCYTTRHGAGPLPHEVPRLPYGGIIDKTNQPNPYQGSLRFAWFDLDLFGDTVMRDLGDGRGRLTLRPHLAMSCLDQIEGSAKFIQNGVLQSAATETLIDKAGKAMGAKATLASYGPTRGTIRATKTSELLSDITANVGDGLLQPVNVIQRDSATAEA